MKFQDISRTFSRTIFGCRCSWHANAARALQPEASIPWGKWSRILHHSHFRWRRNF